jgi:hypothetical protein
MEKREDYEEQKDRDDHESEEEQHSIILFMPKQLEVLVKMNRPDFTGLVEALKKKSFKSVGFKPIKPGNFDEVIDVWLAKMEDYFHVTKVGQQCVVGLVQSYLKGYVSTWWRIVKQKERKTHGYIWEFFKKHIELEFNPKNSDYISRFKFYDLVNATNDNLHKYVRVYTELMLEI